MKRVEQSGNNHFSDNRLIIRSPISVFFIEWVLLICFPVLSQATTFELPENGKRLVGEIQTVIVKEQDTLLDIARKYDLGFNEITDANPGIDPWVPKAGERVLLPMRFILPDAPRKGVVVNLSEMRLYFYPESEKNKVKKVVTHPIGIGREGWETPTGEYQIIRKLEKPSWTMPLSVYQESIANGIKTSRLMPPGPKNPLGEFALQLDADNLLLHGTNMPFSIGMRVSRGCLRLYPEDIRSMVKEVPKGTTVHIVEQPYKVSYEDNTLFLESHKPVGFNIKRNGMNLTPVISRVISSGIANISDRDWDQIISIATKYNGVPTPILEGKSGRSKLLSAVSLPDPFPESE